MISVEGLTVEFGGFTLFDDVSFVVNKKDRIALVGKNGAGKSTMLKIFAGLQSPTSGTVSVPKETTIGYLPQQMKLADTQTVREEAEHAFEHIHEMEKEIERLNQQLAERTDYETESYQNLIDRVTHLTEHFQMMGGNNYHAELERTLVGLGFSREDFDRPTSEFSGGWRMRIELAKLLLRKPDVLLLDEPTNHLDIESIQWLENFIATRANAVILVSHDRAFIDNTTFRTIEIELGKIYDYKVKYSEYVELRKERREQQLRAFENQQKKLADTEAFIERFRYKATKSVQVQSRIKQLEKVERIEVDEVDTAMLSLKFKRNIPVYLISAIFRPNQPFFKSWGKLHRRMLGCFKELFVQDGQSVELLKSIGIKNVRLTGDTRFDRVKQIAENAKQIVKVEQFCDGRPAIVCGSTWPPDEEILLEYINCHPDGYKWIIVPHEIGENHIKAILDKCRKKVARYTSENTDLADKEVLIIDCIGLLSSIYRYGKIAYIGGGFGVGIHNTLEAAVYGIPVIFGPKYQKFNEAVSLIREGGAFSISNGAELSEILDSLIQHPAIAVTAGQKALEYVNSQLGATAVISKALSTTI